MFIVPVKMVVQRRNVYLSGINGFKTYFLYYVHLAGFLKSVTIFSKLVWTMQKR
jgi:hypothetical protein